MRPRALLRFKVKDNVVSLTVRQSPGHRAPVVPGTVPSHQVKRALSIEAGLALTGLGWLFASLVFWGLGNALTGEASETPAGHASAWKGERLVAMRRAR